MASEEEVRAIAYRRQQRAQIAARVQRERAMRGSAAFRRQLDEDWQPYVAARYPIEDVPDRFDDDEVSAWDSIQQM